MVKLSDKDMRLAEAQCCFCSYWTGRDGCTYPEAYEYKPVPGCDLSATPTEGD